MRRKSIRVYSVKRIPQRTCVACGKVKAKRELVRMVRMADGSVEVDTGGKKTGRGAYLCAIQGCWEIGLKGGRLEHSLRIRLAQDNRERLLRFGQDFLKERVSAEGE